MVSYNQSGFSELYTKKSESGRLDLFNSSRHERKQKKTSSQWSTNNVGHMSIK